MPSKNPDARDQAARILLAEAARLSALTPPPCDAGDALHRRAARTGDLMRTDEVAFLTALAAFLQGQPSPEGNPYTILFERKQ